MSKLSIFWRLGYLWEEGEHEASLGVVVDGGVDGGAADVQRHPERGLSDGRGALVNEHGRAPAHLRLDDECVVHLVATESASCPGKAKLCPVVVHPRF